MDLIGREEELEQLLALVDGIHRRGGALVIRGEAGVGKSALLAATSAQAATRGVRVLTAVAVESEMRLPFAGLHELLLPLLDRVEGLPEAQRHALEMALGLAPRDSVPNAFLIGLATLRLVADAAADDPLLCVVEDAQWIDGSSATVLGFVARRLEAEPVLMWFAVRAGMKSLVAAAGLPELELRGLSDEASARLVQAQAPELPSDLRQRILETAAGNPLALIELPLAASTAEESIPLTTRLEQAFAGRLEELDADAGALLLAAALEDAEPTELLRAAAIIRQAPIGGSAVNAATAAGLGALTPDGFRFRHPLVRSAVEQAAPVEARRAAHAALAEVLADDPDRSVWHRADATSGRDETVASELAEAAERANKRGGASSAIAALERSAALTPDSRTRALRLWRAAILSWQLGSPDTRRLYVEAQHAGLPPFEDASASLALETLAGTMSSADALVASFVNVAEGCLAEGSQTDALLALATVSLRAYWGTVDDALRLRASEVARRIDVPPDTPLRLCFLAYVDPIRNGDEVIHQLRRLSPAGLPDAEALLQVGQAATAVWADDLALPFLQVAAAQFRSDGRLGLLGALLAFEAWAHAHRGSVLAALTSAAESGRIAAETGLALYVPAAKLAEAVAVAQRGQDEAARGLIAEAEAILLPRAATPLLSMVALARGRVENAAGRHGEAYHRLIRLFDEGDTVFHPFLGGHALADLVDAAIGGEGDLDLVRRHLDRWSRIAEQTTAPHLQAQIPYAVAVLSDDDDETERLFLAAIAARSAGWQFYTGRARLAYGIWLRRVQRRATDARAPLREAVEIFNALGQQTFAERALSELRASGETARRRAPEAWAELTPQELQIAELAAQGLSNKEIGERLYISDRTVGTHLYHLFPKLGISSRNQLRDALSPARAS